MPHMRVGTDDTQEVSLVHADMHECSKLSHIISRCTQAACLQFILGASDIKKREADTLSRSSTDVADVHIVGK